MEKQPAKPRFCVFCGVAFPSGVQVTRCPGCAAEIPEQYRPVRQPPTRQKFCVFCGFAFPAGIEVVRCPGCGEVVPKQPIPVQRLASYGRPAPDVDRSISYCIYCGEFLVKASFFVGTCPRCYKALPRAPPGEP
ncbi:MAG: hypothetical protein JW839_16055 [Candidatus Lokiarchaeota archaeon]|nr:hypothetical protein [Candidatus Lokiarchaeota archaeon]